MLLLLKQTADSPDRAQPLHLGDERSPIELGSFFDLVFDHDVESTVCLGVAWNPPAPLRAVDPTAEDRTLFEATSIEFHTTVAPTPSGSMAVEDFHYHLGDAASVTMERTEKRKVRKVPEYDLRAEIGGADYLRRTTGRPWTLPAPVKCYGFPDEAYGYFQNSGFLSDLELEFDRQFNERLFYLGPLRSNPLRQYMWRGTHPEDVGPAGDRAVEALLGSRERGRTNARRFDSRGHAIARISVEQHVAEWLKDLDLVHGFSVERLSPDADIYRVRVQKTADSPLVYLTDVGFGVSQILPVLVLLAYVPAGSTVILEQPEIHLHPAVQAGLADVIIEAAVIRGVQVIVESHSEHLLRRLQLRVAEGRVDPETFSLYFCQTSDGESEITQLGLNLFGEIDNWPRDFFGDPFGETSAIVREGIRRRNES